MVWVSMAPTIICLTPSCLPLWDSQWSFPFQELPAAILPCSGTACWFVHPMSFSVTGGVCRFKGGGICTEFWPGRGARWLPPPLCRTHRQMFNSMCVACAMAVSFCTKDIFVITIPDWFLPCSGQSNHHGASVEVTGQCVGANFLHPLCGSGNRT